MVDPFVVHRFRDNGRTVGDRLTPEEDVVDDPDEDDGVDDLLPADLWF